MNNPAAPPPALQGEHPILQFAPLWDNWQVGALIGEGSYGRVYRVFREDIGGVYHSAVKHIRIPKSPEELAEARQIGMDAASITSYFGDFAARIVKEIKTMYTLRGQPNIVSYEDHAIFHEEGQPQWDVLIRMELLTPLQQYQEVHPLSVEDARNLGISICTALCACAKKGIIHRDIKDGNVFVTDDGVFKLGDFGIARNLSEQSASMSMRGTPTYLAPEVFNGKLYDATVDIYSLGILLYKLLNDGRYPFLPPAPDPISYADVEGAFAKRMCGTPIPPPAHGSARLKSAVQRACSFAPADRFHSAEEFLAALRGKAAPAPMGQRPMQPAQPAHTGEGTRANPSEQTLCIATPPAPPIPPAPCPEGSAPQSAAPPGVSTHKKRKRMLAIALPALVACIALAAILISIGRRNDRYQNAINHLDQGNYAAAMQALDELPRPYEDSAGLYTYAQAAVLLQEGNHDGAKALFKEIEDFRDAAARILQCDYLAADALYSSGQYIEARQCFEALHSYGDSPQRAIECAYQLALLDLQAYLQSNLPIDAQTALQSLLALGGAHDAPALYRDLRQSLYDKAVVEIEGILPLLQTYEEGFVQTIAARAEAAEELLRLIPDFADSAALLSAMGALGNIAEIDPSYQALKPHWDLPLIQEMLLSNYFLGWHLTGRWENESTFFYLYPDPTDIMENYQNGLPYFARCYFNSAYVKVTKSQGQRTGPEYGIYESYSNISCHGALYFYIADKNVYDGAPRAWWKVTYALDFPDADTIVIRDVREREYTLSRVK